MREWIPRFGRFGNGPRHATPPEAPRTLELLVIEGPDAGSQFTVDGERIPIGRGVPRSGRTGQIGVHDPTVSPRQAVLRVDDAGVAIEHRAGATNPTLVNGRPVERAPLQVGDRIRMGHTVFELRSRPGISLSGLQEIPRTGPRTGETLGVATTTEVRAVAAPPAELVLLRGIPGREGQRFPLRAGPTRLGRGPGNEVVIDEQGVSRLHAELVWAGSQLVLVHRSATNPTYVDGRRVDDRLELRSGQVVQLADRVQLRIELPGAGERATEAPPPGEAPSLQQLMEEKLRREAEIERDYAFTGSFLDVDVVDSHGLKVRAQRPEHIIVSFERFRAFVRGVVEEHAGQVLNSNGDELMCFFDEPLRAVQAATAVLERLPIFNARENLLPGPFRVRQGIHTGSSLLDRGRGVAYSPVLDVAGHLQKHAPEDGLLVSAETLTRLPQGLPFAAVGELGKEQVSAYRLERTAG